MLLLHCAHPKKIQVVTQSWREFLQSFLQFCIHTSTENQEYTTHHITMCQPDSHHASTAHITPCQHCTHHTVPALHTSHRARTAHITQCQHHTMPALHTSHRASTAHITPCQHCTHHTVPALHTSHRASTAHITPCQHCTHHTVHIVLSVGGTEVFMLVDTKNFTCAHETHSKHMCGKISVNQPEILYTERPHCVLSWRYREATLCSQMEVYTERPHCVLIWR